MANILYDINPLDFCCSGCEIKVDILLDTMEISVIDELIDSIEKRGGSVSRPTFRAGKNGWSSDLHRVRLQCGFAFDFLWRDSDNIVIDEAVCDSLAGLIDPHSAEGGVRMLDEDRLRAFNKEKFEVAAARKKKPPVHPGLLLKEIMEAQSLDIEDVVAKTGVDRLRLSDLLEGSGRFDEPVLSLMGKWLGKTTNVLRNLQKLFDYFVEHGERPDVKIDNDPEKLHAALVYFEAIRPSSKFSVS